MKNTTWIAGFVLTALTDTALSQQNVPAQGQSEALPPIQMISPDRVPLDAKEAAGVRLANEWKKQPGSPTARR